MNSIMYQIISKNKEYFRQILDLDLPPIVLSFTAMCGCLSIVNKGSIQPEEN